MARFIEIDQARKILSLDERATLKEIKESYRQLAFKYHPDRCKENKNWCEEMFKKISNAYDILMVYTAGYRYSFKEKDVRRNSMNKELYQYLKRFYDGWWGNLEIGRAHV